MSPSESKPDVDVQALPNIGQIWLSERGSMFSSGLLMNPMKFGKLRFGVNKPPPDAPSANIPGCCENAAVVMPRATQRERHHFMRAAPMRTSMISSTGAEHQR